MVGLVWLVCDVGPAFLPARSPSLSYPISLGARCVVQVVKSASKRDMIFLTDGGEVTLKCRYITIYFNMEESLPSSIVLAAMFVCVPYLPFYRTFLHIS